MRKLMCNFVYLGFKVFGHTRNNPEEPGKTRKNPEKPRKTQTWVFLGSSGFFRLFPGDKGLPKKDPLSVLLKITNQPQGNSEAA